LQQDRRAVARGGDDLVLAAALRNHKLAARAFQDRALQGDLVIIVVGEQDFGQRDWRRGTKAMQRKGARGRRSRPAAAKSSAAARSPANAQACRTWKLAESTFQRRLAPCPRFSRRRSPAACRSPPGSPSPT